MKDPYYATTEEIFEEFLESDGSEIDPSESNSTKRRSTRKSRRNTNMSIPNSNTRNTPDQISSDNTNNLPLINEYDTINNLYDHKEKYKIPFLPSILKQSTSVHLKKSNELRLKNVIQSEHNQTEINQHPKDLAELENGIYVENSSKLSPLFQNQLSSSTLKEYSKSNNKEEVKYKSDASKSNMKLYECQEESSSAVKISDNVEDESNSDLNELNTSFRIEIENRNRNYINTDVEAHSVLDDTKKHIFNKLLHNRLINYIKSVDDKLVNKINFNLKNINDETCRLFKYFKIWRENIRKISNKNEFQKIAKKGSVKKNTIINKDTIQHDRDDSEERNSNSPESSSGLKNYGSSKRIEIKIKKNPNLLSDLENDQEEEDYEEEEEYSDSVTDEEVEVNIHKKIIKPIGESNIPNVARLNLLNKFQDNLKPNNSDEELKQISDTINETIERGLEPSNGFDNNRNETNMSPSIFTIVHESNLNFQSIEPCIKIPNEENIINESPVKKPPGTNRTYEDEDSIFLNSESSRGNQTNRIARSSKIDIRNNLDKDKVKAYINDELKGKKGNPLQIINQKEKNNHVNEAISNSNIFDMTIQNLETAIIVDNNKNHDDLNEHMMFRNDCIFMNDFVECKPLMFYDSNPLEKIEKIFKSDSVNNNESAENNYETVMNLNNINICSPNNFEYANLKDGNLIENSSETTNHIELIDLKSNPINLKENSNPGYFNLETKTSGKFEINSLPIKLNENLNFCKNLSYFNEGKTSCNLDIKSKIINLTDTTSSNACIYPFNDAINSSLLDLDSSSVNLRNYSNLTFLFPESSFIGKIKKTNNFINLNENYFYQIPVSPIIKKIIIIMSDSNLIPNEILLVQFENTNPISNPKFTSNPLDNINFEGEICFSGADGLSKKIILGDSNINDNLGGAESFSVKEGHKLNKLKISQDETKITVSDTIEFKKSLENKRIEFSMKDSICNIMEEILLFKENISNRPKIESIYVDLKENTTSELSLFKEKSIGLFPNLNLEIKQIFEQNDRNLFIDNNEYINNTKINSNYIDLNPHQDQNLEPYEKSIENININSSFVKIDNSDFRNITESRNAQVTKHASDFQEIKHSDYLKITESSGKKIPNQSEFQEIKDSDSFSVKEFQPINEKISAEFQNIKYSESINIAESPAGKIVNETEFENIKYSDSINVAESFSVKKIETKSFMIRFDYSIFANITESISVQNIDRESEFIEIDSLKDSGNLKITESIIGKKVNTESKFVEIEKSIKPVNFLHSKNVKKMDIQNKKPVIYESGTFYEISQNKILKKLLIGSKKISVNELKIVDSFVHKESELIKKIRMNSRQTSFSDDKIYNINESASINKPLLKSKENIIIEEKSCIFGDSRPILKIQKISSKKHEIERNHFLFPHSKPVKQLTIPSDNAGSKLREFWKNRTEKLADLENKLQTGNNLLERFDFDWEESNELGKEIKHLDIKCSEIVNDMWYHKELVLEKVEPDQDISHLLEFLVNKEFEKLNLYEFISKAIEFASSSLPPSYADDKIIRDLKIFKDKYNSLRTKLTNWNNMRLYRELTNEITQFIIDIHYEFSKTKDATRNMVREENLRVKSYQKMLANNKRKIRTQTERNRMLTAEIIPEIEKLEKKIEEVNKNTESLILKSSFFSKKSKELENILSIITQDTNSSIVSVSKSIHYNNEISFCQNILNALNNESFHSTDAFERISHFKNFIAEKNLDSSVLCDKIMKRYEEYITKITQKNLTELRILRESQIKRDRENKIKLKQIKVFKGTREEEIKALTYKIEEYKYKQNETSQEIRKSSIVPYKKLFEISKILLLVMISVQLVIIFSNRLRFA